MRASAKITAAIAALSMAAGPVGAGCASDAMVVFDGSRSMADRAATLMGEPRIVDARRAVRQALPPIVAQRRIGLIVYGPGNRDACSNIALHFPPRPLADGPIIAAVDALSPQGATPLTGAVEAAAETLDHRRQAGVIVLVTDGKETCGGSPCTLASRLFAEAANLTIHVIGFRVRAEYFDWESGAGAAGQEVPTVARCMADLTGGRYVSTETVDDLVAALEATLGCPLIGAIRPERRAG